MLVNSPYTKSLEELEEICRPQPDAPQFFGMPPFMLTRLHEAADSGNFIALLIGSYLNDAYPVMFETINLPIRILLDLMRQGEMYADKHTVVETFNRHDKTTLHPNTLADAARIGLHPKLIRAIDAADGGIITPLLSSKDAITHVNSPFCFTAHEPGTFTGKPHVGGTETSPIISIGGTDIAVNGANKTTLEIKLGSQATVTVKDTCVFINSDSNYRQTRAINYLLDSLDIQASDYADRHMLLTLLAHKRTMLEISNTADYLEIRRQLADIHNGFDTGYVIDAEYTGSQPVSADAYIRSLHSALSIYSVICSETFNIDIHDNTAETNKDSISSEGVDSTSGV